MSGVSEESSTYDQLMRQLATRQDLYSLQANQPNDLFPFAQQTPEPLLKNLLSETRIIKRVLAQSNSDVGVFRGFYYQLLRLCFEMQSEDSSRDYLQITKQFIFDPELVENEELQQHIKYLAQFFTMMQQQETASFEEIISEYNQIDHAFITLFNTIVTSQSQMSYSDNRTETILNELCEIFEVTVIPTPPFYLFQESNIYLLLQHQSQLFLVYNDDQGSQGSDVSSSEGHLSKNQISSIGREDNKLIDSHKIEVLSREQSQKERQQTPVYLSKGERSRPGSNHSNSSAKSGYFPKSEPQSNNLERIGNYQHQEYQERDIQSFKKGSQRVSNPYQISNQPIYDEPQPRSLYSPPTKDIPSASYEQMKQSNYTNNLSQYLQGPRNTSGQLNTSKNDTIINMFGDMLKSGKFESSVAEEQPRGKRNIQNTEKILESQQQFESQHSSDIYPSFAKKVNDMNTVNMMERAKSVNSVNEHTSEANSGSYMGSKQLEISIPERNSLGSPFSNLQKDFQRKNYSALEVEKSELILKEPRDPQSIVNFDDDDSIFYKPKRSQLKVINQVASSKESITQRNSDKWEDTKGSIYRQFSDTRILKLLKQPHKTKVQLMRNRFKGQHFNT